MTPFGLLPGVSSFFKFDANSLNHTSVISLSLPALILLMSFCFLASPELMTYFSSFMFSVLFSPLLMSLSVLFGWCVPYLIASKVITDLRPFFISLPTGFFTEIIIYVTMSLV
jgi:hypothetical protein